MLTRRRLLSTTIAAPVAASMAGAAFAAPGAPEYGAFGLDLTAIDKSVSPGDDFYRYVNGTWLKTAQIPADQAIWTSFSELLVLNATRTREILEGCANDPAATGSRRMLGDYYASLMDTDTRERLGTAPLQPALKIISAIETPADLARALAGLTRDTPPSQPGGGGRLPPSPIASGVAIDLNDPSRYLPSLNQGGLGMPDRDYYLVDRPDFVTVRTAYRAHVAKMLALAGFDDAEGRAARVYALEERIARSHRTREASRDVDKQNNKLTRADLLSQAPGLDWNAFLTAAGFAGQDLYQVGPPEAITGAAAAARDVPLADWRDYLAYRAARNFAPAGPKAFVAEDYDFEGRVLSGTPQMLDDWKRASQIMDATVGQAVGGLYIDKYFSAEARAKAGGMATNIITAMGQRIRDLAWMSPQTKSRALAKLAAVRIEVGSQTPLRRYDGLVVHRDQAAGNLTRAARLEHDRNLAKLGHPVDRGEWSMNPQLINAQSSPIQVKVMFPAGILQAPFFDVNADAAVNYGGIGVVMGHELSHQFDDQGSKFDEHGALKNWWKPEDLASFKAATQRLVDQYNAYEPLPGIHINGRLTLGENLADLGGLALAYQAYHTSLNGRPAPVLAGLTGDQRFFMAFAQVYRTLQRENALRQSLATNPHSPGEWRAQEVRNSDAWYAAFDVKAGQADYRAPEDRVKVW